MSDTSSAHAKASQPRPRRRVKQQRKCLECGQVFSKAEHLGRHIRSHTKERPFGCQLCGKTYSRHDSLLRHARTHEGQEVEPPPQRELAAVFPPQPTQFGETVTSTGIDQGKGSPDESLPTGPRTSYAESVVTTLHGSSIGQQECRFELDPHHVQNPAPVREPASDMTTSLSTAGGHAATYFMDMSASVINTPTDLGCLDHGLNNYEPAWLLGGDFDVEALNFSISAAIPDWSAQGAAESLEQRRLYAAATALNHLQTLSPSLETVSRVQQKWHTRVSRAVTPQPSNGQRLDQELVDETYRDGLSHRLQPRISNTSLPSADFLNLCIKLYFARFSPVFPIIHAATFRPSSENALLLLSICSVGALFVGSASAAAQGRKIFQILNKAVLVSWENYIRREGREALSLAQAAIIGQTFGMLSGQSQDLCMTESFHGTVIAWARQVGLFKIRDTRTLLDHEIDSCPEMAWRSWAQAEESMRLVLGLHIHDTEFATTFHHEPLLRHTLERLPVCCSEELFTASSAAHWHSLVKQRRRSKSPLSAFPPSHESQMFVYASLAGILASIQEAKGSIIDASSTQSFRERLLGWYNDHHKLAEEPKNKPISLMVLWHMAFVCLYTDFDLLERAIGRDGKLASEKTSSTVQNWVSSSEARRGVLHALLVIKQLETLPVGVELAIHVPKALFYAAIVTHCYANLGPTVNSCTPSQEETNIPELQVSGPTVSSHNSGGQPWPKAFSPIDTSILCNIIDLLRRIGHWEISQRYASILENLLNDLTEP